MAWIINRQKRVKGREISLPSFYQQEEVIQRFKWFLSYLPPVNIAARLWKASPSSKARYTLIPLSQPYMQVTSVHISISQPHSWGTKALVPTEKKPDLTHCTALVILQAGPSWETAVMVRVVKPRSCEWNSVLRKYLFCMT